MGRLKPTDERQKVPLLCLKQTVPLGPYQSPQQDEGEVLVLEGRKPRPRVIGMGAFTDLGLNQFVATQASCLLLGGSEGPETYTEALRSTAYLYQK